MVSNDKINVNEEIKILRKKLLDMSLGNNFLKFKILKRTIPIVDETIEELFKRLIINEQSLEFLPKNEEFEDFENGMDDEKLLLEDRDNMWKIVKSKYDDADKSSDFTLQTDLTEKNLQKRLFTLYQNYKTSITEQGLNTVFLALGFLEWKDVDYQLEAYKAPLILIPIEISRDSVGSPFKIKWDKSDILPNLSLQNKLIEQNVDFPVFEELLDQNDLCDYFNKIKNVISHKSDWNVLSEIYLSTFSFKKLLIYKDLDINNWSEESLKKIDSLLFNPEPTEVSSFEPYELDKIDSNNLYQVLDADSSQMEVIEVIKQSNNLVVEGPPGTGKSQTIVNLIAELMAQKKSVLFISEKMAALEVVKKRLDAIGLGSGCLELHSNKSNKRAVLDDLDKTLNDNSVYDDSLKDYDELNHLKNELNNYFDSLHECYGNTNFYPYMLFGIKERELNYLESKNQDIHTFEIDNLLDFDETIQRKTWADLNNIQTTYDPVCPVSKNPWKNILPDDLAPNKLETIKINLNKLSSDLNQFIIKSDSLSSSLECSKLTYLKDFNYYLTNINVIRPGLFVLKNELPVSAIISNVEKFQFERNNLKLNEKFSSMLFLFSKVEDIKNNLSQLTSLLDEIVLSLNCSNLDYLHDYDKYIENLSLLEPDLKILKENNEVLNLIRNLENYNELFNSINVTENLPLNFKEYYKALKRLVDNLSSLEDISKVISKKTLCSSFYTLSQIESWIDNVNVLSPDMKIINDTDDLKSVVDNVKTFNCYLNSIETNNFSENIGTYKSNINALLINLKKIKESLVDFYSVTEVKINNLKNIDKILDGNVSLEDSNLYKVEDVLDTLINKIHQYKTNAANLNTEIFNLDLEKMLSEVNGFYSQLNNPPVSINLLGNDDIDRIQNQFGEIRDNLMLSPFKEYIDDENIINQLKTVYYTKEYNNDRFNKIFEEIRKNHLNDADTGILIGQFIKNVNELNSLKKELSNSNLDSNNVLNFKEFEIILNYENKLNNIKNKILKYDVFDIKSIEDLQYILAKLTILKGLYGYIISKDDFGNKYFGKYWKSYKSNLDDLITRRNNLIKFNGLIKGYTLDNLSSFEDSSFFISSNDIRNLKKNIIEDIKNINNNFELDFNTMFSLDIGELYCDINDIHEDLIVLEKWESFKRFNTNLKLLDYDLASVKNSVKSLLNYSDDEVFIKICSEINELEKCNEVKQELDSQNEMAKTYFADDWKGYNSDIVSLEKHCSQLIKFNQLVDSGFFAQDIGNNVFNLNFIDLSHKLEDVNSIHENIIKDFNYLDEFSLKNLDINSTHITDLKHQLSEILTNFGDIDEWFMFKSNIGSGNIQNLYHYDFEKLSNSIKNVSYYFDNDMINDISLEIVDLIRLNDLKEQIDSDEFGDKYFKKYWQGSSSNLENINSHYEKLIRFDALVKSQFFTSKTEESLSNFDMTDFKVKLSKLNALKESIFDDFNSLNSLGIFKDNLTNLPIQSVYDKIDFIYDNLSQIKDWEEYKKEKINSYESSDVIYALFDYDFEKVKESFSNLLIDCNFDNNLEKEIKTILELKEIKEYINDNDSKGITYFGDLWDNVDSNTIELNAFFNDLKHFNKLLNSNFYSKNTLSILDEMDYGELKSSINELEYLNKSINNSFTELNSILDFNDILDDENNFNLSLITLNNKFKNLNNNYEELDNLRSFYSHTKANSNPYLENIIPLILDDKLNGECITSLFKFNVANNILNEMVESNDSLRNFNENIYNKNIEKFQIIDKKILRLNQRRVRNILNKNKPIVTGKSIPPASELGILMREINKKKRNISIRQLLSKTGNIISKIKPCFMMSPLSVANFLNPKYFTDYFDYVIFDEASQIKTEDVIGTFFRGKNFVIMGDSKQLPPTIFFESDDVNEDDESLYVENESILKLCRSIFPDKMLKWHYRSRHESLISVSNYEFYNNNLIVFPSPFSESDDLGLKLVYNPKNYYDKGKSRKNVGEAKDVIEYAINHFKYCNTESLGIGTFGIQQKEAILEELEFRLRKNPELEPYFNESGENGFFIKNLENIQGDERDVILISVGYGFDKDGIFTNNFGPLNKNGGERRLNVLITRARKKCVVFCNFLPDDLKVSNSKSHGLKSLKNFLYYAKNKKYPVKMEHTGGEFDSPFEESVYDYLVDNGYEVVKQVGCAGYKIDLAIVDPDNCDKYVLGIECDGATYHSSASARERDRLRQEILERLGWRFHRIWSTDWFNSRTAAKKRLIDAIDEAIKNKDVPLLKPSPITSSTPQSVHSEPSEDLFNDKVDLNYNGSNRYGHTDKEYPVKIEPTGDEFDSPFEESVYDYLVDNGYEVVKQVGCAGYKIDLAIVNPDNCDKYVLGIECDGATYHSSASARERDRMRQEVLEGFGWKFHRIWSSDWFDSREAAKKRLIDAVDEAMKNKDASSFTSSPIISSTPQSVHSEPSQELFKDYKFFKDNVDLNYYGSSRYEQTLLIVNLIKYEQPIHIEDIYESMKIMLNKKKNTKSFKDSISAMVDEKLYSNVIHRKGDYYYHESFDINNFVPRKRIKPTLSRISDYEIKLAIINTLKIQYDTSEEGLIKASSMNLGFNKVGNKIHKRFKKLIQELINEKIIKQNNNSTLGLNNDD